MISVIVGVAVAGPDLVNVSAGRRLIGAACLLVGFATGDALAQPTPIGGEFTVNTYTTGPQRNPTVCYRDAGHFVVAWKDGRASYFGLDHGQDGSETAIVANVVDTGGGSPAAIGPDFVANSYTTGRTESPSVACLPSREFVVVWSELERAYASPASTTTTTMPLGHFAVAGQKFGPSGSPAGGDFVFEIGTGTFGTPDEAAVCRGPNDGFVVLWNSVAQGSDDTKAQIYNAQGIAVGPPFVVVPTGGNEPQCCGGDSGFVVTWWAGGQNDPEVFARRYDATGQPAGTTFVVNTYTSSRQASPAIACNASGEFVIVWSSSPQGGFTPPQDGDGSGVFGQLFDANGDPVGTEFQANTYTTHEQDEATVAMDGPGRFVVAWHRLTYPISGPDVEDIYAQAFDEAGNPAGTEFQVNTYTTETSSNPAAAARPTGEVVITWHTSNDGDDHSISARRFSLGAPVSTTTTTSTTLPPPDPFTVDKSDGDHAWGVDPLIPYDLTVAAVGVPATGVVLTETVPEKTKFDAAASTPGWSCVPNGDAGSTCTYDVGDLAAGSDETVRFATRVDDGTDAFWDVYNEVAVVTAAGSAAASTVEAVDPRGSGSVAQSASDGTPAQAPNDCDIICLGYCFWCLVIDVFDGPGESDCTRLEASKRVALGSDDADASGGSGTGVSGLGPTLYRLRDRVFRDTRGGQRATQLYYAHSPAMGMAALANEDVLSSAIAALQSWRSNLEAIADGEGGVATITQAQIDVLNAFLDALAAVATGDLAAAITRERTRLDVDTWVGISMDDALARLDLLSCEGYETLLFCGELNGDCRVTATDALRVLRIAVGTDSFEQAADMDGSGTVTATDALATLRIAVGIQQPTNACNPT